MPAPKPSTRARCTDYLLTTTTYSSRCSTAPRRGHPNPNPIPNPNPNPNPYPYPYPNEVLDGTETADYVQRVEPSPQGGAKMARALMDVVIGTAASPAGNPWEESDGAPPSPPPSPLASSPLLCCAPSSCAVSRV